MDRFPTFSLIPLKELSFWQLSPLCLSFPACKLELKLMLELILGDHKCYVTEDISAALVAASLSLNVTLWLHALKCGNMRGDLALSPIFQGLPKSSAEQERMQGRGNVWGKATG